jgi:cellulose synthase/poly-beta-1,6-N-acetylglucosamine synthase-like glycosyltransferase
MVYHKNKNKRVAPARYFPSEELPFQIIQLPVFNENVYLVKNLILSACKVSFPRERLIIQLLDDSNIEDISTQLRNFITELKEDRPELPLYYLQRPIRQGFKAGNLNYGLVEAKKMLRKRDDINTNNIIVSIFDADFIIPPNYLMDTVHYFTESDVGGVQVMLSYYNQNTNSLTRAQATFLMNLHHIEFGSRSVTGHLTTYTGSAGSWRLSTIEDSGGWQGDTQIEDVDLSFAAQLRGWKILYLNHLIAMCQLPNRYNDFKLQQRSWMKGLMEVFRKRGGGILKSPNLKLSQKILAIDFFVVLAFQPIFIVVGHLSFIPSYYYLKRLGCGELVGWTTLGLLILLSITHLPFLSIGFKGAPEKTLSRNRSLWCLVQDKFVSIALIPALFITITYGLFEGMLGVKVERDRTTKYDPSGTGKYPVPTKAQHKILVRINRLEIAMSLYSILLVGWAFWQEEVMLGIVCGIFAVYYPLNALISFMNLKPQKRFWSG